MSWGEGFRCLWGRKIRRNWQHEFLSLTERLFPSNCGLTRVMSTDVLVTHLKAPVHNWGTDACETEWMTSRQAANQ
ncbi:MAG TPA: hypothetical protein DCR20_09175 [Planctomycetaceae bacterium]|nr:hypothetical protein [Planctomycetaceae bacterium]